MLKNYMSGGTLYQDDGFIEPGQCCYLVLYNMVMTEDQFLVN